MNPKDLRNIDGELSVGWSLLSKTKKAVMKNKMLVVFSIVLILALFMMIIGENSLLSLVSPVPSSGCKTSIYKHPEQFEGHSVLIFTTHELYSCLGHTIAVRQYWIGNTLYIKMLGVKRPTGFVFPAVGPAETIMDLDYIFPTEGSYQIVLFWNVEFFNVKVESYEIQKAEGEYSINQIESTTETVLLANILYLTPWLLLCIGSLGILLNLFLMAYRKLRA